MTSIPSYFHIPFRPMADPKAVVVSGNARFTVLTSRLIRLEYADDGRFQDQPSQLVWFREQPVPEFTVEEADGRLHIRTSHLLWPQM